jgi:hypothetical protein
MPLFFSAWAWAARACNGSSKKYAGAFGSGDLVKDCCVTYDHARVRVFVDA